MTSQVSSPAEQAEPAEQPGGAAAPPSAGQAPPPLTAQRDPAEGAAS
ncbi:hypothetical protein HCK01_36885, partial [Streptomyces sp. AA8]|nr:hypothetical protein [Streptomyces telluris]